MKTKISAKDAVKIATDYFQFIGNNYGTRLSPEEVELSEDSLKWEIILSYTESPYLSEPTKEYKIFKIDANSGDVLSMKVFHPPAL